MHRDQQFPFALAAPLRNHPAHRMALRADLRRHLCPRTYTRSFASRLRRRREPPPGRGRDCWRGSFRISRAAAGSSCKPLSPTMRFRAHSHPSGVARRQEMRDRRSLSSTLWHGEQDLRTSSLVIGMPESISSFSFSRSALSAVRRRRPAARKRGRGKKLRRELTPSQHPHWETLYARCRVAGILTGIERLRCSAGEGGQRARLSTFDNLFATQVARRMEAGFL